MSTSELRRGPGWWMDLDGSWKPPELWPESSPPLPEWVRSADGSWYDPNAGALPAQPVAAPATLPFTGPLPDTEDPGVEVHVEDLTATTQVERPVPDTAIGVTSEPPRPVAPRSTAEPTGSLQFSETLGVVQPAVEDDLVLTRAVRAAIVAGVLAAALGIGLGLLLATL